MTRVQIAIDDLRDAASLMQAAELLDQGQAFVLVSDGFLTAMLPADLARDGFIRAVLIDAMTPGAGLP